MKGTFLISFMIISLLNCWGLNVQCLVLIMRLILILDLALMVPCNSLSVALQLPPSKGCAWFLCWLGNWCGGDGLSNSFSGTDGIISIAAARGSGDSGELLFVFISISMG